jgi:PBSX family phage terminase large subunit
MTATDGLSPAQLASVRDSTGRVNIWSGAVRSGKTIGSLIRWLIYLATAPTTGELVMIGRTRDSLTRNVIATLQRADLFGDIANYVRYTPGAAMATILGRQVHVIGANDAQAEAKIRGLTCAGAYVDEITVLPETFWRQLLYRMWGPAQIFGTTNPDNPAHWFKTGFLDRINDDGPDGLAHWRHFRFTLDDNPILTEERKDEIKRANIGVFYRRFVLGEWIAAEGAIYGQWDPDQHVIAWAGLPDMERMLAVGMDYGTNNPTAALLLGLGVDRRLYLVDEWRTEKDHRLSDAQLARRFRAWLAESHQPREQQLEPEWVFLDPSAASFGVELGDQGQRNVRDADNDVLYGIRTVASLISNGQLYATERCRGWLTEITGYAWDPKAALKGEDKPLKTADHSLDAGRYALTTTESIWRGRLARTTTAREAA